MKRIFMALLLCTTAQASNLQIQMQDFSFEYREPRGDGQASNFQIGGQKESEKVSVLVEKIEKDFAVTVTGAQEGKYELKNAPSLLTEATHMHIQDLDLSLNAEARVQLASASFVSDEELSLQNFSLNCSRSGASEVMDQLIEGCVQKMNLQASRFSSRSVMAFIQSALGGVGVESLDLKVNSGKFDLAAQVKAQISGKAKARGQISYDAKTKKLSIKITEVKFGIFNVTSKVFDELEKNEGPKMEVKEPYVHLWLN